MSPSKPCGHSTHNSITHPCGYPILGTKFSKRTCSPGIATSLSHSHEAVLAEDSFTFLSPLSRHPGDQGDPPGEEFPGFRALPRGRSQAGLHYVLHHPLWDGFQAEDTQRGRCVPLCSLCPSLGSQPFPTSHHANLISLLFLQQLSARRTSTYG